MQRFLLLLLTAYFLLTGSPVKAQLPELINNPEFRTAARSAVDSVYNFRFDAAMRLLNPWKEKHPDHPIWELMQGMELWWHILSDLEDTSQDERFFHVMGKIDYRSTQLLRRQSSHADALIIKAVSNGYIARQYANRDEWITSVNRSRRALSAYQHLLEVQPELPDLKLAEGLKLYYSAYLPEAYPIVRTVSWFLPEGNKQKGLELMEFAADSAVFARAEANYFLGNINYQYEKDYEEALEYFRLLHETYPRNSYYLRNLVKTYYRLEQKQEALTLIERSLQQWREYQWPFLQVLEEDLLTIKGQIHYEQEQLEDAEAAFTVAFEKGQELPNTGYRNDRARSGFYLGLIHYRMNNKEQAKHYFEKVADMKLDSAYRQKSQEWLDKME